MMKYLLSISILCSRNLEQVKRCIDSVLPIKEELDMELILTDTVGSEELNRLLQNYPAKILRYSWNNDFAAARNLGLKEAEGEWFMYLDDDEWIEDISPLVAFFQSGEYSRFDTANYIQRNYQDVDGNRFVDLWVNRMIRVREESKFCGRIHEYLIPEEGKCKGLPLIVNHTGYLFWDDEERIRHFHRNSSILMEMLQEEPDIMRWRTQLLQEYHSVRDYVKLYELAGASLDYAKQNKMSLPYVVSDTFYVAIAEALLFQKEYKKMEQELKRILEEGQYSLLCKARLRLLLAECFYELEKYEKMESSLLEYFSLKEELIEQGIKYENMRLALFLEDTFAETNLKRAYSLRMMSGMKRNSLEELKEYFGILHWETMPVYVHEGFMELLLNCIGNNSTDVEIQEIAITMFQNNVIRNFLIEQGEIENYPVYRWLVVMKPYENRTESGASDLAKEFVENYKALQGIGEQIRMLRVNGLKKEADDIEKQVRTIAPWL